MEYNCELLHAKGTRLHFLVVTTIAISVVVATAILVLAYRNRTLKLCLLRQSNPTRYFTAGALIAGCIGTLALEHGNASEYFQNGVQTSIGDPGVSNSQELLLCAASISFIAATLCSLIVLRCESVEQEEIERLNAIIRARDNTISTLAFGNKQLTLIESMNMHFDRCIAESTQVYRNPPANRQISAEELVMFVHEFFEELFLNRGVRFRTVLFQRRSKHFVLGPQQVHLTVPAQSPTFQGVRKYFSLNCSRPKQSAVVKIAIESGFCLVTDSMVAHRESTSPFRLLYEGQEQRLRCFAAFSVGLSDKQAPANAVICVDSPQSLFVDESLVVMRQLHFILRNRFAARV